ncbi:MAG: hypothetical protein EBR82_42010 [Caulobacteraceae bacterium]|nr:hypothetical protein [Caulobacteraceae bacterium]
MPNSLRPVIASRHPEVVGWLRTIPTWAEAEVEEWGSVPKLRDAIVAGNLPFRLAQACGAYYHVMSDQPHRGDWIRKRRSESGPVAEIPLEQFLASRPHLMRYSFGVSRVEPTGAPRAIIALDDDHLSWLRLQPGWQDVPVLPNNTKPIELDGWWLAGSPSVAQASWAVRVSTVRWQDWPARRGGATGALRVRAGRRRRHLPRDLPALTSLPLPPTDSRPGDTHAGGGGVVVRPRGFLFTIFLEDVVSSPNLYRGRPNAKLYRGRLTEVGAMRSLVVPRPDLIGAEVTYVLSDEEHDVATEVWLDGRMIQRWVAVGAQFSIEPLGPVDGSAQ